MKNRLIALLCALCALVCVFASCGKDENNSDMIMTVRTITCETVNVLDGETKEDEPYLLADVVVLALDADKTFNAEDFTVKNGNEVVKGYGFRTGGEYGYLNGKHNTMTTVKSETLKKDGADPLVVIFLTDLSSYDVNSITIYYKGKAV